MNLSCKTLSDFGWYKDKFLSKLFQIKDCNNTFWKEKFISELPPRFAEKVHTLIKQNNNGQLTYNYTYGKLIQIINRTSLSLCKVTKINNQLKQKKFERKRIR